MAKAKIMIRSPKGIAVYPHLNAPDYKFNELGVYHTKVRIAPEDFKDFSVKGAPIKPEESETFPEFLGRLAEHVKAEEIENEKDPKKKKKLEGYALCTGCESDMDDEGNELESIIFKPKQVAKAINKREGGFYEFTVRLVGEGKQPVTENIGGGSVIQTLCEIAPFCMHATQTVGLSLRLQAVKVIELVEFGGGEFDEFYAEGGADEPEATNDATEEDPTDF